MVCVVCCFVCGVCVEDGDDNNLIIESLNCHGCNVDGSVHEDRGVAKPRTLNAPSPPSRQEAQEHAVTHLPVRSWCPFCVKGKSKASPHRKTDHGDEPEVPVVDLDYCFLGDSDAVKLHDKSLHPDGHAKALVGRDSRSRCYSVMAVPQKGINADEHATRKCLRFCWKGKWFTWERTTIVCYFF